jgi:Dolichyl-phosphate-mannose-protein mannosyltransferase
VSALTELPNAARERRPFRSLPAPLALTVLSAGAIGLPLLVSWWTGSLGIPHNDGWAFDRVAQTFGRTGHIRLAGWGSMFLVGQVVALGPLAKFVLAQHLFVAATGVAALVSTYLVLVPRVGRRGGLLGSAVVAVWPGFGLLSTSFMTDVPAYAAMMASLALGDVALRRDSWRLLACSLAVGVWGMTIREQAAAALVAVSVVALATTRRRIRTVVLVAATAGLCVGLELWRHGLPHGEAPVLQGAGAFALMHRLVSSYFTLAVPLLPLVLAVATRSWRRRSWVTANIVMVAGLVVLFADQAFVGNYLVRSVAYPAGPSPEVFPRPLWILVLFGALFSGLVLAGAIASGWRAVDHLLGIFTLLSIFFIVAEAALGQALYDRYLLVLVPACVVVTLGRTGTTVPRRSYAALAAVGALSAVTLIATLAYDGARWRVASKSGIPARAIDAGFAWVGAHSTAPADRSGKNTRPGGWYVGMFADSRVCYTLTGSATSPAGKAVRTYRYSWLLGSGTLYLEKVCRG